MSTDATTTDGTPWFIDPWTSGDRFQRARERTGLDQEAFAELIGASRQTVSNYENDNTHRHVMAIVKAWALATETTPAWLLSGDTMQVTEQYSESEDGPGATIIPFPMRSVA